MGREAEQAFGQYKQIMVSTVLGRGAWNIGIDPLIFHMNIGPSLHAIASGINCCVWVCCPRVCI